MLPMMLVALPAGACKVDDLEGHQLGEIIAFRGGLPRVRKVLLPHVGPQPPKFMDERLTRSNRPN